jgi:homoserine O-succinyltransferase
MAVRNLPTSPAGRPRGVQLLRIGLVNNMPDQAFASTERQLSELISEAARSTGGTEVEMRRYALGSIRRKGEAALRLRRDYEPAGSAFDEHLDALVVTGSDPCAERLTDESYWNELATLLASSLGTLRGLLVSCLAAHALMLLVDGIERVALPAKLTGVFNQRSDWGSPLCDGLGSDVLMPHSRRNGIPVAAVLDAGWELVASDPPSPGQAGVGWAVVTKAVRGTAVVAVQAHPEYEPDSLLREYRRDARRHLAGSTEVRPVVPKRCAAPPDQARLTALDAALVSGVAHPDQLDDLDLDAIAARAGWPWRDQAVRLYANWLASLGAGAQGR